MNTIETENPQRSVLEKGTSSAPPVSDELAAQLRSEKAGALVMSARSAHRKGQKEQARALLQQAFKIDPNDCGGLELLGDMFMEDAEQEKALKIFERGRHYHPRHKAFEEKIGLCHVDLAEMRRDRDRRAQILEQGGVEKWMLLSGPRAFGLSMLLPGAGQMYVEQSNRAMTMLGMAVITFLGWSVPLYFYMKYASAMDSKGIFSGFSTALGLMPGPILLWFWGMVAAWIGVYIYSSVDAMTQAEKINELRRQGWDVLEE
jgi:tetratricopeptide (TPR) repeat protein